MPAGFEDPPNAGQPILDAQAVAEAASLEVLARVRRVVLPRLLREAEDREWWSADLSSRSGPGVPPAGTPTIGSLDAAALASLAIAPRTIPPFDPIDSHAILAAGLRSGTRVVAAVAGSTVVGAAIADAAGELLAVGVAPPFRRQGLASSLLRALVDGRPAGIGMAATIGVAERDWVEPLDVETRRDVARRLLTGAGFELRAVSPDVSRDDPWAISGRLAPV
jgi:ribosomal protein S18 acetylase RimI-like enzyme